MECLEADLGEMGAVIAAAEVETAAEAETAVEETEAAAAETDNLDRHFESPAAVLSVNAGTAS